MVERSRHFPAYLPNRRGLLITLFLVLVAVEVATVTAVVMSQRVRTDKALELHTQQLLRGVVDRTRDDALKFLTQAQKVVQLSEKLFASGLLSLEREAELENYFLDQLSIVPQMAGIYFADPGGRFLFSRRNSKDEASTFETKIIDLPNNVRRVRKVWRDDDYLELSREAIAGDNYNPRERPWFVKAMANTELIWSEPYIFFTSGAPGITTAMRVTDAEGKVLGIVGADVELSAISSFLAGEPVAANGGAAVLVHQSGDVLAYPLQDKLQIVEDGRARLARLDELDAVTSRAARALKAKYPNFAALKQSHFDAFVVDGKQIVSMFVPFGDARQWPWLMGVYAPEENFSGTIRAGQQQALVIAIATSIVIMLAAFMLSPALIRPLAALQERASRDPLSGLLNRRSFEELSARPFNQARQGAIELSVIMLDIDFFKAVNDNFGHQVGDEVIVAVAGRLQQTLSATDLVARYGGEEFAILLPGAAAGEANAVAERIRKSIGDSPVSTSAGAVSITVSLGVAGFDNDSDSIADLLSIADFWMLEAKRNGRNCVKGKPPRSRTPESN